MEFRIYAIAMAAYFAQAASQCAMGDLEDDHKSALAYGAASQAWAAIAALPAGSFGIHEVDAAFHGQMPELP